MDWFRVYCGIKGPFPNLRLPLVEAQFPEIYEGRTVVAQVPAFTRLHGISDAAGRELLAMLRQQLGVTQVRGQAHDWSGF